MATAQTAQWVSNSPYIRLLVQVNSQTATQATLGWQLEYYAPYAVSTSQNKSYTAVIAGATVASGSTSINGVTSKIIASGTKTINKTTSTQTIAVSCSMAFNLTFSGVYAGTKSASSSLTVSAKTSYAIAYNANGGSGAPASQTKWAGTTLTLSTTKPTRTGYTFDSWNTAADGSGTAYAPGASYTADAATTLYAQWAANTYVISYNANGGNGAPATQTKTHDVDLTLSSDVPTRENYSFLGWSTSVSSTVVAYGAGATYSANAAATLYAVWKMAYTSPRISNLVVSRCNEDGEANDGGEFTSISFDWATDYEISAVLIQHRKSDSSDWVNTEVSASGTSGEVSELIGDLDSESSYVFLITVSDSNGSTSMTRSIGSSIIPIDFKAGGLGVGIGKAATLDNILDIGFRTRLDGGLLHPVLPIETNLDEVLTPNIYVGANNSTYNYSGLPSGFEDGTFALEVVSMGAEGQVKQTLTVCSKDNSVRYFRFYYEQSWSSWRTENMIYAEDSTTGRSYWGMLNPKQEDSTYVRTTSDGILPYSASEDDASTIGSEVWPFYGVYSRNFYKSGSPIYGEKVLYDNASGTSGTVTLSEDATNFSYIEVFAIAGSRCASQRVVPVSGEHVGFYIGGGSTSTTWDYSGWWTISGTSLTNAANYTYSGTTVTPAKTGEILIYKVVGFV